MKKLTLDYVDNNPGIYYCIGNDINYISSITKLDDDYNVTDYWMSNTGILGKPQEDRYIINDMANFIYYKLEGTIEQILQNNPELLL